MAVWDTEEDKSVKQTFRPFLDQSAKKLKKAADRGEGAQEGAIEEDDDMAQEDDGDSGFEDVSSEEERPKKKHKK